VEFLSEEIMDSGDCDDLNLRLVVGSLMLRHREKWLRFVQKVVQDPQDAEDVLQEAALRMLARGRQFSSAEQARMYLGRIISNTAIEIYHARRRHRRQCQPLHEHLHAASDRGEPERSLFEREELNANARMLSLLHEGLCRLPLKQYQAVRLTVMNPSVVSMRDAGIENDIPYSTLRHRSLQGIRRLRRFLGRALRGFSARLILT
jgi:RNA polymerase sigma factor (sigma-70 family)